MRIGSRGRLAASVLGALAAALAVVGPNLTGCGGGGGGGGGASVAPGATAGFGVLASDPLDGDPAVDPTASLFVTFDQDVDLASIGSATALTGPIALLDDQGPVDSTVRLVTPRVVEVAPAAPLAFHRAHVLRVTTAVRATSGAPLSVEALVRFTTHGPKVPVPSGATSGGQGPWVAGAAEVDMTPAIGAPLAGYGGGDRRRKFPDLNPFNLTTFLVPSAGVKDPCRAKALVIGNGSARVAILTLDSVATEAHILEVAHRKAAGLGFTVPLDHILCTSSHTHSGPGAVSKKMFWQLAAVDLYVDRVFQELTDKVALALVTAEQALGPAVIGVGRESVTAATRNRRAADSPDLEEDDIDDELLVIRVDRPGGAPVATLWNFAIHGTHFGTSNLEFSADIMGSCSNKLEQAGQAGVALFMQGAEGDIAPRGGYDATGQLLADAVMRARAAAPLTAGGFLGSATEAVDFGGATLDLDLQRVGSQLPAALAHNGILNAIQNLGFGIGATIALPRGWMETEFRFQALRLGKTVIASMPGEPIHELGLAIKAEGRARGFDHVLTAGLANGHGAYFTSEKEYGYGGYEGIASLFGPKNGQRLVEAAVRQVEKLKP